MKSKVITTVSTRNNEGLRKLKHSLDHFGYDYHIIQNPEMAWNNVGGWPFIYEYAKQLKAETDYTHLIYNDGFDTLALAPQSEADEAFKRICGDDLNKIVFSAEKNYFPCEEPYGEVTPRVNELFSNERLNLTNNHRWRYANGGQHAGSIDQYIWWWENFPRELNNQYWANKYFTVRNDGRMLLDFNCELFQSVAFSGPDHNATDEFVVIDENYPFFQSDDDGFTPMEAHVPKFRLHNCLTESRPIFAHANGMKGEDFKKNFKFVYDILGI